ncbi:MAG: hypothetical protein AMS17_07685 [Spirochaetes bacterium DG_61]|jgi:hypothetical protein|nr:MAG: hypothetical protein AMS17_07685 [Spirochaetes bacterium DG_61]
MEQLKEIILSNPAQILRLSDPDRLEQVVTELWAVALDESELKVVRKAAKKALYIAKSRGMDIERVKPVIPVKKPPVGQEKELLKLFLTTPDTESSSLLIVVLSNAKTGGLELLRFLLHPWLGVQKFSIEQASKKHLEKFKSTQPDFIDVPVEYGLHRLNRALEKTDPQKISGLSKLPKILRRENADGGEHPMLNLLQVRISRVFNPEYEKKVFQLNEVARLSLPQEEMKEYREEITAARRSKLIVQGRSPEERVTDVIERFYSTYFTQERRAYYREVLLDIALLFYQRDQEEFARILLDYANRLLDITLPAREHPFLSYLVYREFLAR